MKKKLIIFISIFFIGISNIYAKEQVMLAVDTPESVHPTKKVEYYGKEASNYTCELVKNAKKLEIEYDDNSAKMDKYDRLLVWVFTDGKLLQKDLVEKGYAKVAYLYDDYKYTSELEKVQETASANNLGIWNETAKEIYNKENNITENKDITNEEPSTKTKEYSTKDIIIIGILLIIIVFVGDKTIKNKAKKKLKSYLK